MLNFKFELRDETYGSLELVTEHRSYLIMDNIHLEGEWWERVVNYAQAAAAGASALSGSSRTFAITGLDGLYGIVSNRDERDKG